MWIEPYCLKCHGNADDAPETIRETYPNAYGYKPGQLRGVLSIKLPLDRYKKLLWIAGPTTWSGVCFLMG